MPQDHGNCGTGYVYNDHVPDLPRMKDEQVHRVLPNRERPWGFDWPGIGPPPRETRNIPPDIRRGRWRDKN